MQVPCTELRADGGGLCVASRMRESPNSFCANCRLLCVAFGSASRSVRQGVAAASLEASNHLALGDSAVVRSRNGKPCRQFNA